MPEDKAVIQEALTEEKSASSMKGRSSFSSKAEYADLLPESVGIAVPKTAGILEQGN